MASHKLTKDGTVIDRETGKEVAAVTTWADGFGRWHATVRFTGATPDSEARSPKVRTIARQAIRRELAQRYSLPKGYLNLVAEVAAYGADGLPLASFEGTTEQIEYAERIRG